MNIRVNEKFILVYYFIHAICIKRAQGIVCFNCTSTHRSWVQCGLRISNNMFTSNISRHNVMNCNEGVSTFSSVIYCEKAVYYLTIDCLLTPLFLSSVHIKIYCCIDLSSDVR